MVGFGIVQNGSYGYYHSVIVDNIYLGVFLMGGAVGVFLFLINIYYTFKMTYIKYLQTGKLENVCGLAFFVAFLAGGMTENLMHLMYYPYIALMIEKIFNALTYNEGCEVL